MSPRSKFAKGRLRDWLRRSAAAIVLAAFAVLVLQTGAHAGMGTQMMHEHVSDTMMDHHCHPSGEKAGVSRLPVTDRCGADTDGLNSQGDSCDQFCTISVVLPDPSPVDLTVGRDFMETIWSDLPGRSAQGILRPPRPFAVA